MRTFHRTKRVLALIMVGNRVYELGILSKKLQRQLLVPSGNPREGPDHASTVRGDTVDEVAVCVANSTIAVVTLNANTNAGSMRRTQALEPSVRVVS